MYCVVNRCLRRLYEETRERILVTTRLAEEVEGMKEYNGRITQQFQTLNEKVTELKREIEAAQVEPNTKGNKMAFAKIAGIFVGHNKGPTATGGKTIETTAEFHIDELDIAGWFFYFCFFLGLCFFCERQKQIWKTKNKKKTLCKKKKKWMNKGNIVSTEGMVGNMLVRLVSHVGVEMADKMRRDAKPNTPQFAQIWEEFPNNVKTYKPILQRLANMGNICMDDLIKVIIESDEESGRTQNMRQKNRFRLNDLNAHIRSSPLSGPIGDALKEYVIDFMMADMLAHCLQFKDPSDFHTTLAHKLVTKSVSKLYPIEGSSNLGTLSEVWQWKRLRKWGIILSLITPSLANAVSNEIKQSAQRFISLDSQKCLFLFLCFFYFCFLFYFCFIFLVFFFQSCFQFVRCIDVP